MYLRSQFSVVMSAYKRCLVHVYLQFFVEGLMFYLRYLCYLRIVVSNTYCAVVFVLFLFVLCLVFPMLSVSLDCQLLFARPVFSGVSLHNSILVFMSTRFYSITTDSISLNCFCLSPARSERKYAITHSIVLHFLSCDSFSLSSFLC